jgi:hypothetical protein
MQEFTPVDANNTCHNKEEYGRKTKRKNIL